MQHLILAAAIAATASSAFGQTPVLRDNPSPSLDDSSSPRSSIGMSGVLGVECTKAVNDFWASGNCIPASSIPMLGMLYPISTEWLVDPSTGNIGIGITNADAPLTLLGNGATNRVGITQNQVGGNSTMEFTTADQSGDQATRLLLRGGTDTPDFEIYTGSRGSETRQLSINGSSGHISTGGARGTLTVGSSASWSSAP